LRMPGWVGTLKKSAGTIPLMIIGNKADLEDERRVILWREDGPHRLRLPWGGVRILDLWGNETAAPKEAGYSLALTSEPQYILGDRRLTALGLTSDKVPPG